MKSHHHLKVGSLHAATRLNINFLTTKRISANKNHPALRSTLTETPLFESFFDGTNAIDGDSEWNSACADECRRTAVQTDDEAWTTRPT